MPSIDPSALRKLVEPSRKPADTENPARDGKGDHAIGYPRRGDIHGALLAKARLLLPRSVMCIPLYAAVSWKTAVNGSTSYGRKTAVCARSVAIRSTVLPSVHPNIEKPTIDMAVAPITAPRSLFLDSDIFSFFLPRCQEATSSRYYRRDTERVCHPATHLGLAA